MTKPGHNSRAAGPALDRARRIATERGVWFHPNWGVQQIWSAIHWADPAYRAATSAGHKRSMDRIQAGEGFLYVAEVIGDPATIKIGHALDVSARVSSLKADYFMDFRMLASMPAPLTLEKRLHRRLRWAGFGKTRGRKTEFYPRAVLQHPEIPDALKVA